MAQSNEQIAELLDQIAELLETQHANPFRVRAYREGAQTIRSHDQSIGELIEADQFDAVKALPNIGGGIAAVIGEYVSSGKSRLLDDLQGQVSLAEVFARVPGIGGELGKRIADQLDVDTLEELETAAHDGRLLTVEGFGERRVEAVRTALAGMLGRRERGENGGNAERPSVALLLAIDEEYRRRADDLPHIAPRRFNPQREAWLPILRKEQDGWSFTALFSNTAQAHELDKTHDWVVIYYERDGKERQNTIVTETQGKLAGKRVVRGRAAENFQHYGVAAKG